MTNADRPLVDEYGNGCIDLAESLELSAEQIGMIREKSRRSVARFYGLG